MGVALVKIIFVVILSFEVVLVKIIVIKDRENRAVIYTCRYSSGQFIGIKCALEYLLL